MNIQFEINGTEESPTHLREFHQVITMNFKHVEQWDEHVGNFTHLERTIGSLETQLAIMYPWHYKIDLSTIFKHNMGHFSDKQGKCVYCTKEGLNAYANTL